MSATPPPYDRQATFTSFQTPQAPTVGHGLEGEFDAIGASLNSTQARLSEIQRDDGKLANLSVHPDALSSAVRAILSTGNREIRGAWQTGNVYDVGDIVENDGSSYMAAVQHVAGADFSIDLALTKWLPIDTSRAVAGELDAQLRADLSTGAGASRVGFIQSGAGAAGRTVQEKQRDIINALDYRQLGDADGTAMIQRALVEVAAREGGQINLPPGEIVISSTLNITNGVRLVGCGTRFGSASDGTTLKWGGAAGGTMISIDGSIEGVHLEGFGIDGADLAAVCITMNRMRISQFNSLRIRNYRQYGLRLYVDGTSGPNDGIQFNTFQNLYLESSYAGSVGIYLHGNGFTGNPCHNVWSNIGITHVNYAVYLDDCDNNCFVQLYCNGNGGPTHDIYLAGALTRSNYFYHLQGRPLAKALSNNAIFGYDMDNGQSYPDIEATAQLQVIGNSNNFPYWNMTRALNGLLARIPAADPAFGQTGVNASYTGLERPDIGAQLLWGARNSPRQIEGYATTDGTANPLWLILDNFGVQQMMVGGQFITTALAKPTTGTYTAGDYVLNRAPTVLPMAAGNYTVLGWRRLTTGSGHVLNTDWVEMRCLTGT